MGVVDHVAKNCRFDRSATCGLFPKLCFNLLAVTSREGTSTDLEVATSNARWR